MENNLENLLNGQQYKRIYEKKLNQLLKKYRLTKIEVEILLFLDQNEEYDTATDIVEQKGFSKSYVSKGIDSLITKGFLIGTPDEDDRRTIHLTIGKDAAFVIKEARQLHKDLLEVLFDGITTEEREFLEGISKKIKNNMKRALERAE